MRWCKCGVVVEGGNFVSFRSGADDAGGPDSCGCRRRLVNGGLGTGLRAEVVQNQQIAGQQAFQCVVLPLPKCSFSTVDTFWTSDLISPIVPCDNLCLDARTSNCLDTEYLRSFPIPVRAMCLIDNANQMTSNVANSLLKKELEMGMCIHFYSTQAFDPHGMQPML